MPVLEYTDEAVLHLVQVTPTHVDLSEFVIVRVGSVSDSQERRGETRSFGRNTRKFIKSAAPRIRIIDFTLTFETNETAHKLIDWLTEIVYFRDNRGLSIWGTFQRIDQSDDYLWAGRQRSIKVKISEVTMSANVG